LLVVGVVVDEKAVVVAQVVIEQAQVWPLQQEPPTQLLWVLVVLVVVVMLQVAQADQILFFLL
jgi:hypothetical protein